jgi:hypothetical protein
MVAVVQALLAMVVLLPSSQEELVVLVYWYLDTVFLLVLVVLLKMEQMEEMVLTGVVMALEQLLPQERFAGLWYLPIMEFNMLTLEKK